MNINMEIGDTCWAIVDCDDPGKTLAKYNGMRVKIRRTSLSFVDIIEGVDNPSDRIARRLGRFRLIDEDEPSPLFTY